MSYAGFKEPRATVCAVLAMVLQLGKRLGSRSVLPAVQKEACLGLVDGAYL